MMQNWTSVYCSALVLLHCKLFGETNNGKVYYNILQTSCRTLQPTLSLFTCHICYCRLRLKDSNFLCFKTKRHFIWQFPPFLPYDIPYAKALILSTTGDSRGSSMAGNRLLHLLLQIQGIISNQKLSPRWGTCFLFIYSLAQWHIWWFSMAFFLNARDHLDGKRKLWTLSHSVRNS